MFWLASCGLTLETDYVCVGLLRANSNGQQLERVTVEVNTGLTLETDYVCFGLLHAG